MSQAQAAVLAKLAKAVCAAPAKYADETSLTLVGQRWMVETAVAALFTVHVRCGAGGLTALQGDTILGVVTSDR
jgi:hypothetical protein